MTTQPNLRYSRPFDVHRYSNYPEVKRAVTEIFELVQQLDTRQRKRDLPGLKQTVSALALDLYVAWNTDPDLNVSVHKNKDAYIKSISRYSKIHHKFANMMMAQDHFEQLGFMHVHIGTYNRENEFGCLTRIRATTNLIALINRHKVLMPMIEKHPKRELIFLKKTEIKINRKGKPVKVKVLVDYEDTESTNQRRLNLKVMNKAYAEANIDVRLSNEQQRQLNLDVRDDPEKCGINITNKYVHRSFLNRDFEQGGRLSGPFWQYMPKDWRPFITIDGKDTVEIDYSAMHFRILYAFVGHPVPLTEDPYTLTGFTGEGGRKIIKYACNYMLNAESDDSAKHAIARKLIRTDQLPEPYETLGEFMEAIKQRHAPIRDYFNSGAGVHLQYLDSVIAEQVILRMLRYREVVLSVHDSFIVKKTRQGLLEDIMEDAYQQIIGSAVSTTIKEKDREPETTNMDEINSEAMVQELLKMKRDGDTGTSPYSLYETRQAQWHEVHKITYAPDTESISLETNVSSRYLRQVT